MGSGIYGEKSLLNWRLFSQKTEFSLTVFGIKIIFVSADINESDFSVTCKSLEVACCFDFGSIICSRINLKREILEHLTAFSYVV
jgi:hypothetical protein